MYKIITMLTCAALALGACAARPDRIAPSYVSSSQYSGLDCLELHNEATTVADRLNSLSGVQNKKATSDAVLTGVGLVVFWPALIFASGVSGSDHEAEIASLKGQAEALQAAYRSRGCGLHA